MCVCVLPWFLPSCYCHVGDWVILEPESNFYCWVRACCNTGCSCSCVGFLRTVFINVAMHQSKGMLSKSLTGLRNTVAMWPGVLLHKFLHSPSALSVPSCGVLKYFLEPFDQLIASADVYTIQRLLCTSHFTSWAPTLHVMYGFMIVHTYVCYPAL